MRLFIAKLADWPLTSITSVVCMSHTCTCYVCIYCESKVVGDDSTAVKHVIPESISISKIRPVFRRVRCWWCLDTSIGQVSVVVTDWMLKEGNKRRLVRQLLNMHVHVHSIPCSEIVLVRIEKIIILFSWVCLGEGGGTLWWKIWLIYMYIQLCFEFKKLSKITVCWFLCV